MKKRGDICRLIKSNGFIGNSRYYFLMILVLLAGFVAVELVGSCSILLEEEILPSGIIRKLIKLIVMVSLFLGTLVIPLIIVVTRRKFLIPVIVLAFFSLLALVNLLHVRVFSMTIPLTMYFNAQDIRGLFGCAVKLLKIYDLFYLLIPVAVFVTYSLVKPRIEIVPVRKRLITATAMSCISMIFSIGYINILAWKEKTEILSADESVSMTESRSVAEHLFWYHKFVPKKFYCEFGCLNSLAVEAIDDYRSDKYVCTEEHRARIGSYLSSVPPVFIPEGKNTEVVKKNLIILLIESFDSKALTASIGDSSIMSNTARLMKDPGTLVSWRIRHPQQNGISIAGQFNILTGLIALHDAIFSFDYPRCTYPSIVRAMKSRYPDLSSMILIPTVRDFWGQGIVNASVGIDSLFGKEDLDTPEGLRSDSWITDQRIFEIAMDKLKQKKETPFYMLVVTGEMHSPYVETPECGLAFPGDYPAPLRAYYSRANNDDRYIGAFIDSLKKLDGGRVYDESLIVISSDHNVPMRFMPGVRTNGDMDDGRALSGYTPVLFVNTGYDMTETNRALENYEFVQEQIYPTMLSLLGLSEMEYTGLFPSMLDLEKCREWDFSDVSLSAPDPKLQKAFEVSELIIKGNYFGKKKNH